MKRLFNLVPRSTRLVGAVLLSALAVSVSAQEITATLGGVVKDPDGATVPGASVIVVQGNTGAARNTEGQRPVKPHPREYKSQSAEYTAEPRDEIILMQRFVK